MAKASPALNPNGEQIPDDITSPEAPPAEGAKAPETQPETYSQFAHEQALEKIADLEAQLLEVTLERDELKQKLKIQDGDTDHNGPRRLIENFRACGTFGFIALNAGDVITDPHVVQILRDHNAKMVLA